MLLYVPRCRGPEPVAIMHYSPSLTATRIQWRAHRIIRPPIAITTSAGYDELKLDIHTVRGAQSRQGRIRHNTRYYLRFCTVTLKHGEYHPINSGFLCFINVTCGDSHQAS
jgi:hypothetical protein